MCIPEIGGSIVLKHKQVLVTGGGGFLGLAISKRLVKKGARVRSLSRNFYPELETLGIDQIQGDLRDPNAVDKASTDMDIVFHTAAKAGLWGRKKDFYDINVRGTHHVVTSCLQRGVAYLIHTSSPSVVFNGKDMAGVDESVPYPTHYHADYPATKAQAEQIVVQATPTGLNAIILRPHLIWGPGDNHLVPRIIHRAKHLRQIGDGRNLVDTTYIDNAADAHVLAAERLMASPELSGNIYFISQGDPIPLWRMVNNILEAAGLPPVTKRISPLTARLAGSFLEILYKLLRLPGEPRMTRFLAQELSTTHWFNINGAMKDLGYAPKISIRNGLDRLADWLQQ